MKVAPAAIKPPAASEHTMAPVEKKYLHKKKDPNLDMTPDEAALVSQKNWRGYVARHKRGNLNFAATLHLGYELDIIKTRKERKGLVVGFIQHITYMLMLISVFMLQHGRTVTDRYELVETIKGYVGGLKTPSGVTFESIGSIDDLWDWTENAFFEEFGGTDRVYVRTYNQVVGAVKMQTFRVTNASCPYKSSAWAQMVLKSRRDKLYESEAISPACYGDALYGVAEYGQASLPFGPNWDSEKWASTIDPLKQVAMYEVNLGKDPTFAKRKLMELRKQDYTGTGAFLGKETRRAQITMAIYNNAIPCFCFLSLVFDLKRTGTVVKKYSIEAMNVQEYMEDYWWFQVLLELMVIMWTAKQLSGEILELRDSFKEHGFKAGLAEYLSNGWNWLDWIRSFAFIIAMLIWLQIVLDSSRNVDLDTKEVVDLSVIKENFILYNTLFNVIILCALFSMLQYTALDDRMALLTRSIYESMGDLVPFFGLFAIFIVIFGMVGHLLYGPVLYEWSTPEHAIMNAIDLIMGNYIFWQLDEGVNRESSLDNFVAIVYFYIYFFLMMMIVLNIIISILMDGYSSVKEATKSSVKEHLKYNVGPIFGPLFSEMFYIVLRMWYVVIRKPKNQQETIAWDDDTWEPKMKAVCEMRREMGLGLMSRVGQLILDIKALPSQADEKVSWQVKEKFQDREFRPPADLTNPFSEPDMNVMVQEVLFTARDESVRNRKLLLQVQNLSLRMNSLQGGLQRPEVTVTPRQDANGKHVNGKHVPAEVPVGTQVEPLNKEPTQAVMAADVAEAGAPSS